MLNTQPQKHEANNIADHLDTLIPHQVYRRRGQEQEQEQKHLDEHTNGLINLIEETSVNPIAKSSAYSSKKPSCRSVNACMNEIVAMKQVNYTFDEIASKLALNVNEVKSAYNKLSTFQKSITHVRGTRAAPPISVPRDAYKFSTLEAKQEYAIHEDGESEAELEFTDYPLTSHSTITSPKVLSSLTSTALPKLNDTSLPAYHWINDTSDAGVSLNVPVKQESHASSAESHEQSVQSLKRIQQIIVDL